MGIKNILADTTIIIKYQLITINYGD